MIRKNIGASLLGFFCQCPAKGPPGPEKPCRIRAFSPQFVFLELLRRRQHVMKVLFIVYYPYVKKKVKKMEIWREIPTYRHIPATRRGFIILNHGEHGPN
jgi:hypothetical protein